MSTITDFIQYELYPALYERIDTAFPRMEFRRARGGDWHSSHYLNGEPTRPYREDKTVVTRRVPTRALEQGGGSLSLVSLYLQQTGHSPEAKGAELIEALRSLAGICGLTLPEVDTEKYRAYRERQEGLEKAASEMTTALFSEDGRGTLRYLTHERGYSEEEILAMGLGYCSEAIAKQLDGAPLGAGTDYTLAIPYRSGGRLLGFKLRAVEKWVKPKYKNTAGLPKSASLFGLTGLKLTGNGEKDRDLTIVEGELDALRAQIRGVENIVAAAGLDVSEEALKEAKRRGVKRITVLTDTEESEEHAREEARRGRYDEDEAARRAEKRRADNEEKVGRAIHTIAASGLVPLVATLPAGEDGEKVDVDSYLNEHSKEELQKIIDGAQTGANYLFYRIYDKAVARQGGEPTITDKAYNDYKEETIALLNDVEVVSPVDKDIILSLFAKSTDGVGITKEALLAEADARKQAEDRIRQDRLTKELLEKAQSLASSGETEETIKLLAENLPKLRKIAKETEFSSLLTTPTADSIREKLRTRPEGVRTGYVLSTGNRAERLVLPAGGITLVAAPTTHGKSTFLRNLALQTAMDGEEGTVLYFSFEEDTESTVVEFVNTYVGLELTTPSKDYNNLTTIAEYYRTDSTRYIKHEAVDTFKEKEAEFMRDYVEAGRLRIYDNDYSSNELIDAIQYIAKSLKVKAVFVDYVQLLYREGNRLQRNEELKEIAKELRQTAKALKLPIVLAAQLNRDAKSPTEMHSQNIADSADLEREANKVLLLWNSAFNPTNGNAYEERKIEVEKRPELGQGGRIYARLAKNRGGVPNIDALLNFNGNTGRIETNYEEDLPEEEPRLAF